jgi:hypothetical protein
MLENGVVGLVWFMVFNATFNNISIYKIKEIKDKIKIISSLFRLRDVGIIYDMF